MTSFNVVVLDDERESADMLCELLTLYLPDAMVKPVYTGEEAVAAAADITAEVMILDLEMAGLGGEGAALAVRAQRPDQTLPLLVAVSGNVGRLAKLRHAGTFDHVLSKPIDVVALVDLIERGQERRAVARLEGG